MSKSNNLSNKVRHSAASVKSLSRSHEQDNLDTHEYLSLIASLHKEWDRLEAMGSTSVMPRPRSIMEAILAETRHGKQVEMPATDLGPYSMSEFSLRALIRRTVDSVPDARSWRSSFEHAPSNGEHRGLGVPEVVSCRISVHGAIESLPQLAQQVRDAVREACDKNLGFSPTVNVHIEDIHHDD